MPHLRYLKLLVSVQRPLSRAGRMASPGLCLILLMLFVLALSTGPAATAQVRHAKHLETLTPDGQYPLITQEDEARMMAADVDAGLSGGSRGGLIYKVIPASYTGTGYTEPIQYQIPSASPPPEGYPLFVAWHCYIWGCTGPAYWTQLDEECEKRGWAYLSITGATQCHFGNLLAQQHVSIAITYFIEELGIPVDLNRIYMGGFCMGGTAALSYACRHMSLEEGYPVAGVVLVSPIFDWAHSYNSGDIGVQQWLPILLGGGPDEYPFKYKQISLLTVENNTSYVLNESMGQNLRHKLPFFVTYAQNDPKAELIIQMEIFLEMMDDLGCEYFLDYKYYSSQPHNWAMLDAKLALDYIQNFNLDHQETDPLAILVDRPAKFYWADVKNQFADDEFCVVQGSASSELNSLSVLEATNVDTLKIDCKSTGLDDQDNLMVVFQSSCPQTQLLYLAPIPTGPTYVVDDAGVLYAWSDYNANFKQLSLGFVPASDQDLKVSFEPYNLTLDGEDEVQIGDKLTLIQGGGDPYDPYVLLFSVIQVENTIGSHHLLVYPFKPTVWIIGSLDAWGASTMPINVPYDPLLVGLTIYNQFVTCEGGGIKEISNLSSTKFIK